MRRWDVVIDHASAHAVVPLTHAALAAHAPDLTPPDVLQTLATRRRSGIGLSLLLTSDLLEATERLEEAGISTMALKGPGLALLAYGDLGLRQFTDIDVLVRPRDVDAALEVLGAAGFDRIKVQTSGQEAAARWTDYHIPLLNRRTGTTLELHWGFAVPNAGYQLHAEWAFAHARSVRVRERGLRVLSWEALLVYLCVHGSKHAWARFAWICDIAACVRAAAGVSWAAVDRLAREVGARRMVALGMRLAQDAIGVSAPARPVPHLLEARLEHIASRVLHDVAVLEATDVTVGISLRDQITLCDHVGDVVRLLARTAFMPNRRDVRSIALPKWLHGAYWLVKPVRIVSRRVMRTAAPRWRASAR